MAGFARILQRAQSGSLEGQSLVMVRQAGQKMAQHSLHTLTKGRMNPMKLLNALLSKGFVPDDRKGEVEQLLADLESHLKTIGDFQANAGEWVMTSVATEIGNMYAAISRAESISSKTVSYTHLTLPTIYSV